MKKTLLIIPLLFLANYLVAQDKEVSISKIETSSSIYLAYNSSLIYPGFRTGIQVPITKIEVNKIRKNNKPKHYTKNRFITANVGWYTHQNFHQNLYFTAGYTSRRISAKGFMTEFSPELGYSRTFINRITYQVDDNSVISPKQGAGYNHMIVSLGGGLGYDFSPIHKKPITVYWKLNLMMMLPYNNTIYLRPAMELGLIYQPSNFLKVNTRLKNINKK